MDETDRKCSVPYPETLISAMTDWIVMPGNYADITAFAGDPLEDFETMNHVRFVMKDGKIYKNI